MFTVYDDGFKPIADLLRSQSKIDGCKGDFSSLIPKDAENFVLSPEMALSVEELSRKFNSSLDIAGYRLPYASVVVELPITQEVLQLRGGVRQGMAPVARVAALITQEGGPEPENLRTTFTPFWQFADGTMGLAANTFYFGGWGKLPFAQTVRCHGTDKNVELYATDAGPSLLFMHAMYASGAKPSPAQLQELGRKLFYNQYYVRQGVEEITALLFAWLSILDCKSGVRRTRAEAITSKQGTVAGKLGKRISAKRNTSAYTTISLLHSEVEVGRKIKRNEELSAHTVRGHFKKRATGTFWWHPFIRGTGVPRCRKAYIVKP